METLGQFLKREREFRRVPLQEIAETSKVNLYFLTQLEADNHEALPEPAFIRGYLKSYAQFVGLDVSDVLLRYDMILEKKGVVSSRPKIKGFSRLSKGGRVALFLGIFFAIILIALYLSSR